VVEIFARELVVPRLNDALRVTDHILHFARDFDVLKGLHVRGSRGVAVPRLTPTKRSMFRKRGVCQRSGPPRGRAFSMCQKAAEEDGDHTDDPEESEIGIVDHAQPPTWSSRFTFSARLGAVCLLHTWRHVRHW
jgi:hypothetical protein